MTRRAILFLAVLGAMLGVAAFSLQKDKPTLLLLDWAAKAHNDNPPAAVLIEMGLKDVKPTSWSSKATVTGAKVVRREGYRFRPSDGDKLVEPDRWEASSHRGVRAPANPKMADLEPVATVGVVLHLADVQADAQLIIDPRPDGPGKAAVVALKDVLAGKKALLWDGAAVVRRISAAAPVVTDKTEDDFPAACYGPDGTLWVAYISYTVKEENRRIETAPLKEQPKDYKAYYTPEFGDQLFVKYYRDGKWGEPIAVTGPKEDLVRCAIAAEKSGDVWIVYAAHRRGKHSLYLRALANPWGKDARPGAAPRLGDERELTPEGWSGLSPVACTRQDGAVYGVGQALPQAEPKKGGAPAQRFFAITEFSGQGGKTEIQTEASQGSPVWGAAVAAGPDGQTALADDSYDADYDVHAVVNKGGEASRPFRIASSRYEARPSICFDAKGRLWVAYEEGPKLWGKDYGALDDDDGNPLYNERSVRVVCLQDGKLFRPAAELPTSLFKSPSLPFEAPKTQKFEEATRYSNPQIGLDGKGRVWLTYRQKFGSRYSSHPGSYWLTFARRLDGDQWSEPIEVHHSDGLLDHRPVLLPHPAGGLRIVHNTDGRYTTPETIDNQIYLSYVDLPGEPVEPKLVPHDPGNKDDKLVQRAKAEAAAVKRIRDYRIEAGGKKYQLLRGEFHRHTEISWDGGPDGSLEDMFRYGLDAAAMDWIGNGDHDSGGGREYSWWLIQKFTDAYHVKDRFTPMFTYERSVSYPHGHRNCVFARRGVRTLPRLAEFDLKKRVGGFHADDTKMLYRYLKELDGICAVHTSATSMGTDWRDNDPAVEPIVEIYQGDRMSYEIEGAPRAGYDPETGRFPGNVAGWYPLGFVNHAFKKGYKLGFQASSDHWSTHISYCIVLAERHDRAAILDAMKKRHCYGATDDLIVDVRSGKYLMGDEFKTAAAPALEINVIGTKEIAQIVVLKDSEVVETIKPGKREYQGKWTDPKPTPGVHYYYVRVQQADGELAWASPMWIEYSK